MRVMIAGFDLYRAMGGGQSVYRRLVETNPDIDFWYLRVAEDEDAERPANAHPVPFREEMVGAAVLAGYRELEPPRWTLGPFLRANNIAMSVAGMAFDVVELPDYEQFGIFLAPALRRHRVAFDRVVLALHGSISKTISLNWATEGSTNAALQAQERMQYQVADTRYGISPQYIDDWRERFDLDVRFLHPMRFATLPVPSASERSSRPPAINFVGRTEKCKGPDIFVELVGYLPRWSYGRASIIGPQSVAPDGTGSSFFLSRMAQNRGIDVDILPPKSPAELRDIFASRTVTVLPSRFDSLNLLAIESLFAGCPTAIGSGAGVCRFLDEFYPSIPYVRIDVDNPFASIAEIVDLLTNYDAHREALVAAVRAAETRLTGSTLAEIYISPKSSDAAVRARLDTWFDTLAGTWSGRSPGIRLLGRAAKFGRRVIPARGCGNVLGRLRSLRGMVAGRVAGFVRSTWFCDDARIVGLARAARRLPQRYREISLAPEQSDSDLSRKVEMCWSVCDGSPVDRVRVWLEIARLERLRGNDLIAATYELRSMRILGGDRFGHLSTAVATLRKHGYGPVANACHAMFGDPATRRDRCLELIERAYAANKSNPERSFEFVDDRRPKKGYRVSIIVSLYNAAAKIRRFVTSLKNQTLFGQGGAELIFVETGSSARDYDAFLQAVVPLGLPVVYARTAERETIQSAWNRGIHLATGDYLSFLGVDESIQPNCLELLAAELDADADLDWIQANSLVTEVDPRGNWLHDVMGYDRAGGRRSSVYLDTCYLSWVGALYRRSIHDRFGYYDASFQAAGDTEFKTRLLPHLKTKYHPDTLGVFWNYPDDRMTQSPRAEIEDLRAWHLHRTAAGAHYAFRDRPREEAERLFLDCLQYRKSFCRHWSTDLELAESLAAFLRDAHPDSRVLRFASGVRLLLDGYRALDLLPRLARPAPATTLLETRRRTAAIEGEHRSMLRGDGSSTYRIFNDNRYEQHSFTWRSEIG